MVTNSDTKLTRENISSNIYKGMETSNTLYACMHTLDTPYTGYVEKHEKIYTYNSGSLQLLSGFCLTHPMLCNCDIKQKSLLLLCILKWLRRETI